MIAGLSKAVTLYLSTLLSLTALLLAFFTYLAPVFLLADRVSLLAVVPSNVLTSKNDSGNIDGPTLHIGALGSCSRPNNDASFSCTAPSLSPVYDLSDLPSNAPALLTAPAATAPVFLAISMFFSSLFVIIFTIISFRSKMGERISATLDKPFINRAVAWVGVFGFMIGLISFLILRMWFGKAADDFNLGIEALGDSAPSIVAEIANGFTMVWVAYAFLAVPLVCSLAKLHVTAGK